MFTSEKFLSVALPLFGIGLGLSQPRVLSAQTNGSGALVSLTRLTAPVTLDGSIDEAIWEAITPLPLVVREPIHRARPTERTEIRVAYDDSFLYVAAQMYDSNPEGIRVKSLYRDQDDGDDILGLLVNPYDDNEIGLVFWTNPAGIRGDAEVPTDAQTVFNRNWNTHWAVATRLTGEGWFAEMRIPFSSLGFQTSGGAVPLAFTVYRYIARKNERQIFPDIAPEYNYVRSSLAYGTEVYGIDSRRPVHVSPYVLGGAGQVSVPVASGYELDTEPAHEAGLDVKYNLGDNLTLDLSVNTDFAQVEADDQQVNLTRLPLFFPEKRQFFLERSGTFDFLTGGSSRLFHSRTIGLAEGEPVRILGGVRLVGRLGEWDVGFLSMQTDDNSSLPSENMGVGRVRRRVINDRSNAGAMITTRMGTDGRYNVAYGLDTRINVSGDDYLSIQWAQTIDRDAIDAAGFRFGESALARITYSRARNRGWTYGFDARYQGEDYAPRLGFTERENFTEFNYYVAFFHYPTGSGPFRRIDPLQLFGNVVLRNGDRTVESAYVEHNLDLNWKRGSSLWLDLELYYDDLTEPLGLPNETVVPIGSYTYPRVEGGVETAPGNLFRFEVGGGVQRFFDGWLANLDVEPAWTVSRHLGISAAYSFNRVRFPGRDQGFDSHLVGIRTNAAVDTRLSLNAFFQLSSTSDLAAANVRFRYNLREGTDLWVVYNHGLNLDRDRQVPLLPQTESRTFLVKYTHTFSW